MTRRPNLLLIMSDQHHKSVLGCAGDDVIRTPSLDGLAARGTRFTNAYCGSPLCVPSRMTFLTARHCSEIEVYTNRCTLGSDIATFAHGLGAAGYEVILGGRMHFVGPDQRHGFHRRLIGDVSTSEFGGPGVDLGSIPGGATGQTRTVVETAGPGRCCYQVYDEAVTASCEQFLRERGRAGNPFCLVTGYVLPHCPLVAEPERFEYYLQRVGLPDIPEDYWDHEPPVIRQLREHRRLLDLTEEQVRRARAAYYALVEHCDRLVGRLLATLQEAGLAEDTLVLYCSDHGEAAGENGLWCKTTFYEGAAGVPLIISGPGLPEGRTCDLNASLLDLGPTLLDLVGGEPMPEVAGRSLRPLLEGRVPDGWDDTIRSEMIVDDEVLPDGCMVKQGPWKLMHYEGHEPLLFNLDEDPREQVNRAGEPGLHWLREQLHQRALAGWDPQRARSVLRRRARDRGLLTSWRKAVNKPDPDHWDAPEGSNVYGVDS